MENIHYLCLADIDAQKTSLAESRFSAKHQLTKGYGGEKDKIPDRGADVR